MSLRRTVVASLLILALGTSIAAAGVRDHPQLRFTAADQKLARAVVLRQADVGPAWTGGLVKAAVRESRVDGYTLADLVVTGEAASRFRSSFGNMRSTVHVLKTAEMVQLDRRRMASIPIPERVRSAYEADPAIRLVSASRLGGLPSNADAIRVVYDFAANGETQRQINDHIWIFEGRTETVLDVFTVYQGRNLVMGPERAMVRLVTERARAGL